VAGFPGRLGIPVASRTTSGFIPTLSIGTTLSSRVSSGATALCIFLALDLIGPTLCLIGVFLSLVCTIFSTVGFPLLLIGPILGIAFPLTLPIVRTRRLFLFLLFLLSRRFFLEIEISRFYGRDWFNTFRSNSRE
jgi:hypothetical protein